MCHHSRAASVSAPPDTETAQRPIESGCHAPINDNPAAVTALQCMPCSTALQHQSSSTCQPHNISRRTQFSKGVGTPIILAEAKVMLRGKPAQRLAGLYHLEHCMQRRASPLRKMTQLYCSVTTSAATLYLRLQHRTCNQSVRSNTAAALP